MPTFDDDQPMPAEPICGATAANCTCTLQAGHEAEPDGCPHACDPVECGGQWTGTADTDDFVMVAPPLFNSQRFTGWVSGDWDYPWDDAARWPGYEYPPIDTEPIDPANPITRAFLESFTNGAVKAAAALDVLARAMRTTSARMMLTGATIQLHRAQRIRNGRRRHGQVKHARDIRRSIRHVEHW